MEKKYTAILSKIGETLSLDNESRQALTSIDDGYYINYSENWSNNIIKSYTDNELINIFKGLIIAEQCYSQLCGSATVGKFLYREIEYRNLDDNLKIANWAYTTTRNGYIPFDSSGNIRAKSKDAYEFVQNSKEYSIQINDEQEGKEKRLRIKKIEGLEKTLSQKENEIITLKSRLELAKLSRTEIANEVINDNSKPVYYYYHEIETLINDKSVDKILLEKILKKFKEKERKNIKDLKNRLLEEITNR
jgi:hypothetical protein